MKALFIAYILSALLFLAYASDKKKRRNSKTRTGELGGRVQKAELSQTSLLIEQPRGLGQSPKLADKSLKRRNRLQKTEIRKPRQQLKRQPAVSGSKSDKLSNNNDKLPIHEQSKEDIEKLGYETRKSLTKNLTAEQWNTFLGKWLDQETGKLAREPLFYLSLLDNERKVELMREADEKSLDLLFVALVPRGYAPKSPKVIELIEKRLEDFPGLRSEALVTLYTLGFPPSKWHFTSSKKDLEVLCDVIKAGKLKWKQVNDHLPEMVAADSVPETASASLLALLMEKNLVNHDDFCNPIPYQKACGTGNKRYLRKVKEFCPALPFDPKCTDEAVEGGHESILEYFGKKLRQEISPSQQAVDAAAANGKLEMLQKKCHLWMRFPSVKGANSAAKNGHLSILEWMASLDPSILPTADGADCAAENGHHNILIWMASLEPSIIPTANGANHAAKSGHLRILVWMAKQDPPILPTADGASLAAKNGHLPILKWMKGLNPSVLPTTNGANWAAMNDHFFILEWMASLKQPVLPTKDGANWAAKNGHLHILEWMASLDPPILPTAEGVNMAAGRGHLSILEWMASLKQPSLPAEDGANYAAMNGHLHILEWMSNLNPPILPTVNGASYAARNGHFRTLEWMASLDPPILPIAYAANLAAKNAHLHLLKWMASLDPPILPTAGGANWAAENDQLCILVWMAKQDPPILPTEDGANLAAENGHLYTLKWMKNLNPPILPTKHGANLAKLKGQFHVLQFLEKLNLPVYPN